MAGDWIKMRAALLRHPKVLAMADALAFNPAFVRWMTEPVRKSAENAYDHVTPAVTRAVTVCALLSVWCTANEVGKRRANAPNDCILEHATLAHLDDICGVPGMGEAMESVGWAEVVADGDGLENAIKLPDFYTFNTPMDDRAKASNAERQRRFRAANSNGDSNVMRNVMRNVTRNAKSNAREEKRRVEETLIQIQKQRPQPP